MVGSLREEAGGVNYCEVGESGKEMRRERERGQGERNRAEE